MGPDQVVPIGGVMPDAAPATTPAPAIVPIGAVMPEPAGGAMNFAVVNGQRVPVEESGGLGTFVRHYGEQINPVPLGQLLPFPQALGGAGWDAPVTAMKNILQAQNAVKTQADAAWQKGDHVEAVGHYLNWLLPVIGPVLDKAGNELRAGKFAAGAGDTLGLATTLFGPKAVQVARESAAAGKLATAAEKGATTRAVETMAPQVGPNKVRFGNMAAQVGPDVLRETSAVTRGGLLEQAGTKLADSYSALDAAYDVIPDTRQYITAPVKSALNQALTKLTVSGSGGSIEPATRAARIASLRQAIAEVTALGPTSNLDNLRKLRIAWDEGAQAVFTPSVAQDFLKARGTGHGWADARSALNDYIVSQHPELRPLNADAHLWKQAVDVMQAAEEADRVRPKVGRSIMARGLGAATGGAAQGPIGAAVGAVIGPSIERVLANLQPAMKITVGRQMTRLADALQAGQTQRVTSILQTLQTLLKPALLKAGQVGAGTLAPPLVPATSGAAAVVAPTEQTTAKGPTNAFGQSLPLRPDQDYLGLAMDTLRGLTVGTSDPKDSQVAKAATVLAAAVPFLGGTKALKAAVAAEIAARDVGAAKGIRAYHGSPHDFEQFSTAKIGTGEGAQVYGHGLYFAEKEGTAKSYRDQLSGPQYNPEWMRLHQRELDLLGEIAHIKETIERESVARGATGSPGWGTLGASHPDVTATWAPDLKRVEAELSAVRQQMSPLSSTIDVPGKMYEVNIKAHPEQMLDWDKPLHEQPQAIQDLMRARYPEQIAYMTARSRLEAQITALADQYGQRGDSFKDAIARAPEAVQAKWRELIANHRQMVANEPAVALPGSGEAIYRSFGGGPENASRILKEQGVPGIKYLDQGSRAAGAGTRNFVIFDDALIDVLKKYGIAGAVAASLRREFHLAQARARQAPATAGPP